MQIVIIGLGQSPITNRWSMTDNAGVDSDDNTPPSSLSARAAVNAKKPRREGKLFSSGSIKCSLVCLVRTPLWVCACEDKSDYFFVHHVQSNLDALAVCRHHQEVKLFGSCKNYKERRQHFIERMMASVLV